MQPVFSLKDGQKPGVLCREGCKGYIAFTDRDAGTGGGIKKTAGGGLFYTYYAFYTFRSVPAARVCSRMACFAAASSRRRMASSISR